MRKKIKFHLEGDAIFFDEEITMSSNDKMIYDYVYNENKGLILKNIYFESYITIEKKIIEVINTLLDHLPDSNHNDKSWKWCWETLSGDAQEEVKEARSRSYQLVSELIVEITKKEEDENANPNG